MMCDIYNFRKKYLNTTVTCFILYEYDVLVPVSFLRDLHKPRYWHHPVRIYSSHQAIIQGRRHRLQEIISYIFSVHGYLIHCGAVITLYNMSRYYTQYHITTAEHKSDFELTGEIWCVHSANLWSKITAL